MPSPVTGSPQADSGLPPGVQVGPLGARLVAYLVDSVVPAAVVLALRVLLPGLAGTPRLMASLAAVVVILGWAVFVWQTTATRAASPGMRAVHLQLVGFLDGRPIGWGRVVLRSLIFSALALTGIGLVVMLVLLLLHPRKQGWHDQATQSVIIKARALAPKQKTAAPNGQSKVTGSSTAPLPVTVSTTSGVAAAVTGPPTPAAEAPVTPLVAPTSYGPEIRYQQSGPAPSPSPYAPPAPRDAPPPRSTASPPPAPEPAPPREEWVIKLDDGREIVVDGLVLLGRNPQPQPGEEDAQLIKLADQTRTVSKSHLAAGVNGSGAYVVDRGSTNGSTVTAPNGSATRCRPGDVVSVEPGSIVSMGDHWLEMSRRPVAD